MARLLQGPNLVATELSWDMTHGLTSGGITTERGITTNAIDSG